MKKMIAALTAMIMTVCLAFPLFSAEKEKQETIPKPGTIFRAGITTLSVNPYSPNDLNLEAGFALWYKDFIGMDIVFAYSGCLDDSYTRNKVSTSPASSEITGTTTAFIYHDGGSIEYTKTTGYKFSFTLLPKWKVIKHENSYFYLGFPLSFALPYQTKDNVLDTSKSWNIDDVHYLLSKTTTNTINETTYNFCFTGGLLAGVSYQFEKIPGLELTLGAGFRFGINRTKSGKQYTTEKEIFYNSDGSVLSIGDHEYLGGSGKVDGQVSCDSRGDEFFYQVGVSYFVF